MPKTDKKLHKLKYWRSVLNLTQTDVATLLGCKKANYCEKENGNTEMSIFEAFTIQKAFNKMLVKQGRPELTIDDIFLT